LKGQRIYETQIKINGTVCSFGQTNHRPVRASVRKCVWRVSGKTMTIDSLIEDQARHVNSPDISVLAAFSGRLPDKLKEANAVEYPGLREAVHIIIQFLGITGGPAGERSVAALDGRDWLCCGLPPETI
jgi:hypothetical protein